MFIFKILFVLASSFAVEQEPPLEPPYTTAPAGEFKVRPLEKPESISEEGEYFYRTKDAPDAVYHKLDHIPPIKGAIFLRLASTTAFDITGDGGRTYKQVYGEKNGVGIVFDYELNLFQMLGKWTAKFSTGLTVGNGTGQFSDPANANLTPREKFLMLLSPHTALLNYKMRFSDTQWFVPYIEGGPGYYTYLEWRDDDKKKGFGGAPVLAAGGGVLISLSLIDRTSAGLFYEDYGINHVWIDLNIRRNQGLDDEKDFTSNVFSAGFGFAF